MASRYDGSRSPVRAISTASRAGWAASAQRPLSWSEPTVSPAAPQPALPVDLPVNLPLACPNCGAAVRLALTADRQADHTSTGLRSAPSPEALPDFDDAVTEYKRDLVRRALDDNDGVMTRAAKALGLKYTTFVAMVHRLDANGSDAGAAEDQR